MKPAGSTGCNNFSGRGGSSLKIRPTAKRAQGGQRWEESLQLIIAEKKKFERKESIELIIVSATGFAQGEKWKWWVKGVESFQGEITRRIFNQ